MQASIRHSYLESLELLREKVMKKMILAALLCAPSAYAYESCVVDLTDSSRYLIDQFVATGVNEQEACRDALRECNRERLQLERGGGYTGLVCERNLGGGHQPPGGGSNRNIRSGDQVIPDTYSSGYANVISLFANEVMVRGNYSSSNATYGYEQIALMQGCLGSSCVADQVIPDTYSSGHATVKAINFSKSTYTVLGNYSSSYSRFSAHDLAIMNGCVGSYCVNEQVIPETYSSGYATVKAVNNNKNSITVLGNYSSSYSRFNPNNVAKMQGCLMGICVGDRVVPNTYSNGYATVKAINFATNDFTVLGNYSSSYSRFKAHQLGRTR